MAHAIGTDMHDVGIQQGLSPLLDVVRDYRWGRVEETIGEDPYLVATLGTAYVQGIQGAGVDATLKHFAGYSASRAARNHAPVTIGRREFEDVILYPFEMAVREGGTHCVMNSYSDIDGEPAGASHWLLTEVLRDRWGFEGVVVSDYWSVSFLESMHKTAESPAGAAAAALRAGLDVELPELSCYAQLHQAVEDGTFDIGIIDVSVRRVLEQKLRHGLLDADWSPDQFLRGTLDFDSARNRDIAYEAAAKSIILLHNSEALLPLSDPAQKIAVIGPCGDEPRTFMGCYAFPNHVLSRFDERGTGLEMDSFYQALRKRLGVERVTYEPGVPILEEDRSGIDAAVASAAAADIAIVTVGDLAGMFGTGTSGEGCDVVDLHLPGLQRELVERILDTGTPVILLVISGRPYSLGQFAHRSAAIVQAFMPGVEAGRALVDVLTGVVNPSGHLPVSIPDHAGGQPGTYLGAKLSRYADAVSNLDPRPLFPFGHGLSYTRFEYSNLTVSAPEFEVGETLTVTVDVANTGPRSGDDVVQLYLSDEVAEVTRPVIELIGFQRVSLEPGEIKRVTFDVHSDRTSFTGLRYERVVEPGWLTLSVGSSSEDIAASTRVELTGTTTVIPEGRILSTPASASALE
jgi:beta-glucosidase